MKRIWYLGISWSLEDLAVGIPRRYGRLNWTWTHGNEQKNTDAIFSRTLTSTLSYKRNPFRGEDGTQDSSA